jgi:hypothetical protein
MIATIATPGRWCLLAGIVVAAVLALGFADARCDDLPADGIGAPAASGTASNAANEKVPRLTVQLRDGSRVIGTSPDESWRFHSPILGDLNVSLAEIRSIEFAGDGDTARLTATNGDGFEVQFTDAALQVKASFGNTELPVKLVKTVDISTSTEPGQLPSGLVGRWSGDGNANDSVGGHNGTLEGGATFSPGMAGQAFTFNGVDAAVNLGKWFTLQTFSVGLWVKPDPSQCAYANIMDEHGTNFDGWNFQYGKRGVDLYAGVSQADGRGPTIKSPLAPNTWQYLMMTRTDDGVTSLYFNGKLIDSKTASGPIHYSGNLHLGRWDEGGRFFSGQEEEIEIYDRALSPEEVQGIYSQEK